MNRLIYGLSIIFTCLILASCAMMPFNKVSDELRGNTPSNYAPAAEAPAEMLEMAFEEAGGGDYAAKTEMSLTDSDPERIVIKNANLSIVVKDPNHAIDEIVDLAEESGGFVVSSNIYKTTTSSGVEVPVANITIRVPAEKLEDTLESIKDLVDNPDLDILNEEVSGQDVTSEVTDLESRLRNLQKAEQQLLEIMDAATETEDVMSVFRELTYIREQIEVLEGQIKYYRESARLSAISVYIQAQEAIAPITVGGWRPAAEIQKALQALIDGLKYLANFAIWLIIFLAPFILIIGLPIYLIVKAIKKRKKKPNTEKK